MLLIPGSIVATRRGFLFFDASPWDESHGYIQEPLRGSIWSASVVPFEIGAQDGFALFAQAGVDDFADHQGMVAGFVDFADFALDVGEGLFEDRSTPLLFCEVDLVDFVAGHVEWLFQGLDDVAVFFVDQVDGEVAAVFDEVVGVGSFANGDHQQWWIKGALGNPACSHGVHFAVVPDAKDVDGVWKVS